MAGKRRSVYLSDRRLAQWQRLGQPPLGAALGIGFDVMEARAAEQAGGLDPVVVQHSGPDPLQEALDSQRAAWGLANPGAPPPVGVSGHALGCQEVRPHFMPNQCVVPLGQLLTDSPADVDAHQAGCVRLDPHFATQCAVPFVDPDGRYQGGNT